MWIFQNLKRTILRNKSYWKFQIFELFSNLSIYTHYYYCCCCCCCCCCHHRHHKHPFNFFFKKKKFHLEQWHESLFTVNNDKYYSHPFFLYIPNSIKNIKGSTDILNLCFDSKLNDPFSLDVFLLLFFFKFMS